MTGATLDELFGELWTDMVSAIAIEPPASKAAAENIANDFIP
jgi:hypothetical protein